MPSPALAAALPLATATDATSGYDGFIGWVLSLMDTLGEVGVGAALLAETFIPPIPSEAVLPAAGFLAWEGRMSPVGAWLAATLAALVGAWIWYAVGAALGPVRTRRLVGRLPLLEHEDFDRAERFFARWGGTAVLVGRCVPLVRSFISIPAGIERMPLPVFSLWTVLGSGVWNALWIGLGYAFGPAIRPVLEEWSAVLSTLVLAAAGLAVGVFLVRRVVARTRATRRNPALD
ncbi:DedA family protein [Actinomyces provencensis]|uniref:DedA family protein n=1 Tax=Actinomyces provencensis TaxID=1720198 RepID=UPI00096A5C7C|nr:DedA family protein [Actinomyces provencensis]